MFLSDILRSSKLNKLEIPYTILNHSKYDLENPLN